MGTMADEGEVIVLSDDDCEDDLSNTEPSVLIVDMEDVKNNDSVLSPSQLDEDLVVTFSRRAEVLPHARYDCPINPFTATDHDTTQPVAGNQLICDQCFCYICDKLASSCEVWSQGGECHCNSHKKSEFWSNLRNGALLGGLRTFDLTLSEIDAQLRHAERMLQSFKRELLVVYTSFLMGKAPADCGLSQTNQKDQVYDYTPVYECVSSFLNKADIQNDRAAAVMRLGAIEGFISHSQISGTVSSRSPMADPAQAKVALLKRVVASVQRQMVTSNFTPEFTQKLQKFFTKLCFFPELKNMSSSLCVRHWEDVLLVSVLKGQNVCGFRKDKGRKDVLIEQISVVLHRTKLLQCQCRFRELCRYLRVVQTNDAQTFQLVKDLIPFFLCKDGELYKALSALCPSNSIISRFTPQLFLLYFRIFETATAPNVMAYCPAQLCSPNALWEPVKDAVPMKREELVKFALRVQKYCTPVYNNDHCWSSLLTLVNTAHGSSSGLLAPSADFLQTAKTAVPSILHHPVIYIPTLFLKECPDQALLLLVTGALSLRILDNAVNPVLPVLCAFKDNMWALVWLMDILSSSEDCFNSFLQQIAEEKENLGDEDVASFLQALLPAARCSSMNQDHTYCSPMPKRLCSSQITTLSECRRRAVDVLSLRLHHQSGDFGTQ
ncbi:uncharacterized protein zgc:112980 [Thalassophryne amazonica]|uniref:uncharacterized protein zgc:112980 n=1 Tax=Thalassophryne amazonica TaxID=390379 RepID=UPI0014723FFC|nr:uncharacterized protein zgc:112980 [Thalassophryne amazonica]